MSQVQIDDCDFFLGAGETPVDSTDYEGLTKWIDHCSRNPELLALRNEAIRKAWSCPERKARQAAASASKAHLIVNPESNAKRSASGKAALADPEKRRRISEQKKEYWRRWRDARAAGSK